MYPDGETVAYRYNRAGMLDAVTGARGGVARTHIQQLSYDHYGRQRRIVYGNGAQTEFDFDPVEQRLNEQRTSAGGAQIQRLQFQYNAVGLISRIENAMTAGPNRGPTFQQFQYDELDQLRSAFGTFNQDDGKQRRYQLQAKYDEIGRMQTMVQTDELLGPNGPAATVGTTTHNYSYTYEAGRRGRASSVGPFNYQFDANGNVTDRVDTNSNVRRMMRWDDENRLIQVKERSKRTDFIYDAGGTRTHKSGEFGTTAYPNAFITIASTGEVTKHVFANGQRVTSVVTSNNGAPAQDRVYWLHANHLGGAHYVTDAVGNVREHLESLPFGESWIEQRTGQDSAAYQFTGVERDRESGLIYIGARYLDPREGRWMSRDPAMEAFVVHGGVADPRNLLSYGYAFHSPISYVDRDGRETEPAGATTSSSAARDRPARVWNPETGEWEGQVWVIGHRNPPPPAQASDGEQSWFSGARQAFESLLNLQHAAATLPFRLVDRIHNPVLTVVTMPLRMMNEGPANLLRDWYAVETGRSAEHHRAATTSETVMSAINVAGTALGLGEVGAVRSAATRELRAASNALEGLQGGCSGGQCVAGSGLCFAAGTTVMTEDGPRPIEDVEVGDRVLSVDPELGAEGLGVVTQLHRRHNVETVIVSVRDGQERRDIETTREHPFWVLGQGWVAAERLHASDVLWSNHGNTLTVRSVRSSGHRIDVFNFTVERWHAYFVGTGVLVHNDCLLLSAGEPVGTVIGGALEAHEVSFAQQIIEHVGGTFQGVRPRDFAGIDGGIITHGVDGYLNVVPVSLKGTTTRSPVAILRIVGEASIKAANAGYSGVEVFIRAPNISSARLLDFARSGTLSNHVGGTLRGVNVYTRQGWIRFVRNAFVAGR